MRERHLLGPCQCDCWPVAGPSLRALPDASTQPPASAGAAVVNYAAVVGIDVAGGQVRGARVADLLTGSEVAVSARTVLVAAGPWTDGVVAMASPTRSAPRSAARWAMAWNLVCEGGIGDAAIGLKSVDGDPVAGALCLRGGDTLYGRYWGASETVPGLHFETCYYQGIDHCLREGLTRFEPGAQGEHKLARGFLPTLVRSRHWIAHEEFRDALREWCAQETTSVRRYAATLASHSPFKHDGAGGASGLHRHRQIGWGGWELRDRVRIFLYHHCLR